MFTRDDDPDLIRDATPFALKLYESLLESVPNHVPLLISTCGSFTQYGYAFLEAEADGLDASRRAEATALRERALKHYLRGRGYCLRAIDVRFGKGTSAGASAGSGAAVAKARKDDVPLLYWTAASWGAAISLGIDRPDLAVDFPTVRALADRALALDPTWNKGAIHELMISLDSLPEALGGNADAGPRALQDGRGDPEGLVARSVCGAGHWRRRAGTGSCGVRAAAQGSAGDRSGEGSVESSRHPDHPAARPRAARSDRREVLEMIARSADLEEDRMSASKNRTRTRRRRRWSHPSSLLGRHHRQAGHAGAGQFVVAQGAARHGRRVGSEDGRTREADGLRGRHARQRGARRSA